MRDCESNELVRPTELLGDEESEPALKGWNETLGRRVIAGSVALRAADRSAESLDALSDKLPTRPRPVALAKLSSSGRPRWVSGGCGTDCACGLSGLCVGVVVLLASRAELMALVDSSLSVAST